jgi:hypothetical protein
MPIRFEQAISTLMAVPLSIYYRGQSFCTAVLTCIGNLIILYIVTRRSLNVSQYFHSHMFRMLDPLPRTRHCLSTRRIQHVNMPRMSPHNEFVIPFPAQLARPFPCNHGSRSFA